MTLRELRDTRPELFYPQSWFDGEAFLERDVTSVPMPDLVLPTTDARNAPILMSAATLAGLYAKDRSDPIWGHYLWTADLDQYGQRVYVGDNGRGLEIHRHLHLTDRWGVPLWT